MSTHQLRTAIDTRFEAASDAVLTSMEQYCSAKPEETVANAPLADVC
jgi:hypothetical protein